MGRFNVVFVCLVVTFLGVLPSVGFGHSYYNGYTYDGYTYNNGYWYKGGYGHNRSLVYNTPTYYYSNGYYYQQPSTYYYSYAQVPDAPAYPTPTPTPTYSKDWRVNLLEVAKQRDQFEGGIRKAELEQKNYMDAVGALGLTGNFRWQNYGTYPPHQGYGGQYSYGQSLYTPPVQGNTLYGYSVNTLKEYYGETNMNTLYQQAARLTQNAQNLAGQGNADFQSLVSAAGGNAARVAEILAKGQAVRNALESNVVPPSTRETTTTTITGNASSVEGSVPIMPNAEGELKTPLPTGARDSKIFLAQVAMPLCGQCHGSKDPKGGFDIGSYPGLSLDGKAKVWGRLLTEDKKKRMPKDGPSLTGPQLQAFFTN